jgi:chorismate synthase
VTCVIRACPKGLGSPVFDKLEAELAKAFMSLPASKVRMHRPPPASYHGECCLK